MKKNVLFLTVLALISVITFAQEPVLEKTFIVNGGRFANQAEHVSVGYYDHNDEDYHVFDSIYTQSTQNAIMDETTLYVCAQDTLVSYNIETLERIASVSIEGLNRLAIYQNKLIVTRQYPITTESVLLLNKETLEIEKIIELSAEASGVLVYENLCFVAVPGAWGTTEPKLAIINMETENVQEEVYLGEDARGIRELFYKDGFIYTVNTHFSDYTNNTISITEFGILSNDFETTVISGDYYAYSGNSVFNGYSLYIPLSQGIASYNIQTGTINNGIIDGVFARLAFDDVNQRIHVTTADYASEGMYNIYDLNGEQIGNSIQVGISPEAMALQYDTVDDFTFDDIECWVGEGEHKAMLVIDWNDDVIPTSLAWGYRFNGESITGNDMMNAISEADSYLTVNISNGFLDDHLYNSGTIVHNGIGGEPDWWSTWSRTPAMSWSMNQGVTTLVRDGDRFGCSYGFSPSATEPDMPIAATDEGLIGTNDVADLNIKIYSKENNILISSDNYIQSIQVYNLSGQIMVDHKINSNSQNIPTFGFPKGIYVVKLVVDDKIVTKKISIK